MLLVYKPECLYALYKTAKIYREQKHEYHTLLKYKHKLRHGIIDKHYCDINKWVLTNDLKVLREAAWRM